MREVGKFAYVSGHEMTNNYSWEIQNFADYFSKDPYTCLTTPIFLTPYSQHPKIETMSREWRIKLYPRNPTKEFNNHSSIFLQYFGKNEVAVTLKFTYSWSSSWPTRYNLGDSIATSKELKTAFFNPRKASYGFQDFINHSSPFGLETQPHNTLVMKCTIAYEFPHDIPKTLHHAHVVCKVCGLPEDSSQEDFDKLFEIELFGDVTVTIGQKQKSLHKAILASRSDVFRAMFQHDMTEKVRNVVDIADIRLEVAMEMFRYIYTGKINNIENLPVSELLIAAEKYAITGLKAICEKVLCNDLDVHNALEYLTLASMHNSANLKTKVMEFIVKYLEEFVDKPQFKLLDQSIVCELLTVAAKKK